ncbi:hypothetical protein EFK50_20595 [Nocardioides marmoriginsengisoli]|uniref:Lipoprotein n=1 Tax=Nocardioides marmoriginsengisoli TaxID=661483 RepID=A0A3N0CB78_9ACTN|nr:hypothetical protein [Nocardioides marmoriginsengisoli]RNL60707.1 hypothetical protein EFK50_20595 [Nocardioides marmoriginsengisoli]
MVVFTRANKVSTLFLSGLLAGLLILSGCSASGDRDESPQAGPTTNRGGAVDPQVLADAVAAAFPVPGPSMRRMMRVNNFTVDFVSVACGSTEHRSIDRTMERYSQDEFPDLDLIRTKGFVEKDPAADREGPPPGFRRGCDARSKGNLFETMPSHRAWLGLVEPWEDVLATVEQEPSVVALKEPFAQCLRDGTKGTGVVISSDDPARTFVTQTDKAYVVGTITAREREHRIPKLYARCGSAYFGRTQELLEAKRPAMIERHRELLEQAARELVAMGYVP